MYHWFSNRAKDVTAGTGKKKLLDLTTRKRRLRKTHVYLSMYCDKVMKKVQEHWETYLVSIEEGDNAMPYLVFLNEEVADQLEEESREVKDVVKAVCEERIPFHGADESDDERAEREARERQR